MSYSKGPLEVGHDGPSRPIICGPDGKMLSISAFEYGRWGSYDNEEDDCRLFAAAQELLEALKEVVAISDRKHDAWDKARAAYTKATGKEQQ
jgi:hypothetical protein